MRGIELVRDAGEPAASHAPTRPPKPTPQKPPTRPHKPTPQKPPLRGKLVDAGPRAAKPPPVRRDPATVGGLRSGIHCPECRVELLHQDLGILACPGCGLGYWMRGAQLIPEGEHDPIDIPDTTLPQARARIRKREPDED